MARYALDRLVDRRVLESIDERIRLRVPLFAGWLQGPGAAMVRASFGERDLELALRQVRVGVKDQEIVEIARDFSYQETAVNEIRIKAWLEQFGDAKSQRLMFALLKRLREHGYYSSAKVFQKFKTLHGLIIADQASTGWAQQVRKGRATNVFVSSLDREGKSGSALIYSYRNANSIPDSLAGSQTDLVEFLKRTQTPSIIIFVDDLIGSGGSCSEGFGRFRQTLIEQNINANIHAFYMAAVVGIRAGVVNAEQRSADELRIFAADQLDSRSRAFSPDAEVFSSDSDRLEAQRLCKAIGEGLEPKHPLGYEDSQGLILFSHRCPNNTLPIFFKTGKQYLGRDWQPLFPR